jgi:N4-gp56 family major capsid protein
MARTIVGLNDAKAVKRYSGFLSVDVARTSYFSRKFMGEGENASMPIQRLTQLENDAGEQITFDLSMQLKMQPVEGDSVLEGKEEALSFYTDAVYIDQMRGGVNTGGRMTRKRTLHDLRIVARKRQSEWWARVFDELFFMYLSGARGVNTEFVFPLTYTGFSNNSFTAPDSEHIVFAGGTTKATMTTGNKMALAEIDRCVAYAGMMGGGIQGTPKIQPIMIDGEKHFVCVMNPYQVYDLRAAAATAGSWMDIQKAAATAEGRNNPIFKGGLGMYNNVVLHEHECCIRFTDYGSASPAVVAACRALFLGTQAAVCAFGSPGSGLRFDWNEESRDNGNQAVITTASIFGVKKVTFNGKDFGVIAIDTAAARP